MLIGSKIYQKIVLIACLIMMMFITGCEFPVLLNQKLSSEKETDSHSNIVGSSVKENNSSDPRDISSDSQANFFETGKPAEESERSNAEQSVILSKLKPIYSVAKGDVALTIDDGPTKYTIELLRVLKENDAKVTFFFLGQNAATYPQSVSEAVYLGHEIGYHSNSHPKMTDMNLENQENEFDLGLNKLEKIGHKVITLFRPPYGSYNNDTKLVTEKHKMNMVLWNEDPRDWSTTVPSLIVERVLSQVHSGGIVVLHDRQSTIAALPEIIKGIRKKGLKLVTIPSE